MALTGYLTLEGQSQGKMEGDCTQKGREKTILVYAVDHTVEIPRDNLTGKASGQRIHRPLTITKHTDPASPLIYQACAAGEEFKKWQLDYYHIDEKGQEKLYYSITLEKAIAVAVRHTKRHVMDENNKPYHDEEEVSFTYSGITWENKEANKTASDSWDKPQGG